MKNRLNIYCNCNIKNFLKLILYQYDLNFLKLETPVYNFSTTEVNIFVITSNKELKLINLKELNDNYLILSNLKNSSLTLNNNSKVLITPISINHIKNTIKNLIQNLKVQFHDIFIDNEKITNLKDNSFCYLTKIELEILSYLIREREVSKKFIKENVLKIKSDIETNSLESHLTRIRKKMIKVNTILKIHTKSEKLLISV